VQPFFEEDGITILQGDARELIYQVDAQVVISDPPYGVNFLSSQGSEWRNTPIVGDRDDSLARWIVSYCRTKLLPAAVFWGVRIARPEGWKGCLVWSKGEHAGLGDLSFPWKPCHEEIYIFGEGWHRPPGRRGGSVLEYPAECGTYAMRKGGRLHPVEKPLGLMVELIEHAPPGVIVDPFCGSGTTLEAAKRLGRTAIGIEIDERFCRTAAERLRQKELGLSWF